MTDRHHRAWPAREASGWAWPAREASGRALAAGCARLAAALAVLVLAVAVVMGHPLAASAQTPGSKITLTDQTTWVDNSGTFRVGVAVTTPDPSSAQVQVSVYRALSSRSDFDQSLANHVDTSPLKIFNPMPLSTLGASPELLVAVNPTSLSQVTQFVDLSVTGVYPVTVDLYDANDNLLSALTTHLVYNGPDTRSNSRLDVAWVAPFSAAPTTGASAAVTRADAAGLLNLTGALAAHANVEVTVAATPQTVDALASGSASDRSTATQLGQVLAPGMPSELVAAPYVRLDLPAMLNAGLESEIGDQVSVGNEVLASALHAVPVSATWIATGPLSAAAVDDLAGRGVQRIVVADNTLTPFPVDDRTRTLAQPFTVLGKSSRLMAVSADAGLAVHFQDTGDPLLSAHQLLAELAVIQLELPNRRGGRGVVIVPPAGWQANATFLATFLDGLATAPMLAPVTVDQLFANVTSLQEGAGPLVRGVVPAAQQPRGQTIGDGAAIRAARLPLASLSTVVPEGTPLIAEIDHELLVSESADISEGARASEVAAATASIDHLKSMVRLPGNQSITFTARQGLIPISMLSSAPYPLRVRIRVTSQKLGFRPVGLSGGGCVETTTSEICTVVLRAQNTTVRVPVVAKTTGVFSFTVELASPDGALTLASDQDTVRSTAASGVGLVLSIGAALLLAVWWARDVRHGRRARKLVPQGLDGPGGWPSPAGDPGHGAAVLARAPVGAAAPDDGTDWLLASFGLDVAGSLDATRPRVGVGAAARWRWEDEDQSGRITQPIPIIPVDMPFETPQPPPPAGAGGQEQEPSSFSRNTAVMATGTLLSRLTGFARVLALIWAFGITSGLTDVYTVANTAPNILYDLVLGGILSATLVPVFVDYLNHDDPAEGNRAISAVVTAITVTLLGFSVIFWLLAPAIIRFYLVLNNSANVASERAIGTALLHMFVPQLFLLGGIAVTTALLNARRRFAAAAFSPVVNNVVAVAAIVAARMVATTLTIPGFSHDQSALLILGLGTTAGYLFQLLVQIPPLFRAGFRLRPVWDLKHPAVRTVLRLSLWTFGSVIANQISFNLILVLADHRKGDVAVFNTAYQFFQLPYAIFAVSIASVITPDLSEQWARRDLPGFRRQMAAGLRLTLAVLIPAAVGYVVLAQPFLSLVLHHGSFTSGDSGRVGGVVVLFAVGLPGFSGYLLLMRAYQSMQDTRSMFWLYLLENAATLVLAGALYPVMGVRGLALGWVAAYTIGAVAAFAHLRRRTQGLDGRAIASGLSKIGAATALMALPVVALVHLLPGRSDVVLLAQVGGGVVAGTAVYLGAAYVLGITELTSLLKRRRPQ